MFMRLGISSGVMKTWSILFWPLVWVPNGLWCGNLVRKGSIILCVVINFSIPDAWDVMASLKSPPRMIACPFVRRVFMNASKSLIDAWRG